MTRSKVWIVMLLVSPHAAALACAVAPRAGQSVEVAAEEAILVWDAARKVQHFIRRADFRTAAPDFGFLVPTPTQPELAEAPDSAFGRLQELLRPRVVRRVRRRVRAGLLLFGLLGTTMAPDGAVRATGSAVEVLDRRRVGGFDAAVLAASDPVALGQWLARHGYPSRPALVRWLAPYVAQGWKITAFKIARGAEGGGQLGTAAVRMSCSTPRPFFPYREPDDQRSAGGRLLRVYFVGPQRVEGQVGAARWPGELKYAGRPAGLAGWLAGALPAGAGQAGAWVTIHEDRSAPRPGGDELYFAPAAAQHEVLPPPIVRVVYRDYLVPVDLLVLLAVGLAAAAWIARRRRLAA